MAPARRICIEPLPQPQAAGEGTVIQMITSNMPLTRRIKLVLAMFVVIALSAGSIQAASAQPSHKGKNHQFSRTYVIDGWYGKGLLVAPSEISEGQESDITQRRGFKDLTWEDWGQAQATGRGWFYYTPQMIGVPATLTMSGRKRCGPYWLYTRMTISYEGDLGTTPEPKYLRKWACLLTLPTDVRDPTAGGGMVSLRPQQFISSAKGEVDLFYLHWNRWNTSEANARGVVALHRLTADLHQPVMPASVKASRPRYCRHSGTIAYTRLRVTGYGTPLLSWSSNADVRRLRNGVGKGKRHHYSVSRSLRRWCAQPYEEYVGFVEVPGTS